MTTALDPDRAVLPDPPRLPDLTERDAEVVDAWWRAAMYLTVAQIYLRENALLREPLLAAHVKPRLLGHWGTSRETWA